MEEQEILFKAACCYAGAAQKFDVSSWPNM
jgi:hypothetical protein